MRFNASMFSLSHFFPRPTSPPLDNCIRELSPFAAGNEDTRCIMHLSLLPSRRYITPPEINPSDVSRMETKLSRTCFLLFFLFVSSKLKLFPLLFAAPNMFSFLNYDHELNHLKNYDRTIPWKSWKRSLLEKERLFLCNAYK